MLSNLLTGKQSNPPSPHSSAGTLTRESVFSTCCCPEVTRKNTRTGNSHLPLERPSQLSLVLITAGPSMDTTCLLDSTIQWKGFSPPITRSHSLFSLPLTLCPPPQTLSPYQFSFTGLKCVSSLPYLLKNRVLINLNF